MRRVMFAVLVAAAALPGSAVLAQESSWLCADDMDQDRHELEARAPSLGVRRIMEEYRVRWDAVYKRQQCEAFAAGEFFEISCLNGRRDWDSIEAMVPEEFFGMSNSDLRPHYLELQEADDGHAAAMDYCRQVGAID